MIKLYKVVKHKTSIRGYWLNNGKLYRDFIQVITCDNQEALQQGITSLFNQGELAVFYSVKSSGYCINKQGELTIYNYRLRLHRHKLSVREIKKLVLGFGGVTIYKIYDRYIIEVYHN